MILYIMPVSLVDMFGCLFLVLLGLSDPLTSYTERWTSFVLSVSGYKYYLVIIDDCTHYSWTFLGKKFFASRKPWCLQPLTCFKIGSVFLQ
jgi:hypothetical protein